MCVLENAQQSLRKTRLSDTGLAEERDSVCFGSTYTKTEERWVED